MNPYLQYMYSQSEAAMEQYVGAMERQARQWSASFPQDVEFADLTLGGGTPLLLPERQLERVFRIATEGMGFEPAGRHIVVETSPGQTTEEKLWLLKEHHVTRVSMGVQSFRGEDLEAIHRSHSVEQVERALECIQKVGFPCVNLDLIYGIPGQTVSGLWQSLERALAYAGQYYQRCYIETLHNMTAANRFYRKYGFTPLDAPLLDTGHFSCDVWYIKEL